MALDADEAGGFELLHVVGERGRADGLCFVQAATGRGALAAADLGEDFVASRLGERLGNEGELLVGELDGFAGALFGHCFYLTPDWPSGTRWTSADILAARVEAAMFERYSEAARRVVFLSRKIAGERAATEIGVEDLIEALVLVDQGKFAGAFSQDRGPGVAIPMMPNHRPFLTAHAADVIHRGLQALMAPNGTPLPTSVDMPVSAALKRVLERTKELSEELRDEPDAPWRLRAGDIQTLHLLAAILAEETSDVAKIVKNAGVEREAVIAAIRNGEYST